MEVRKSPVISISPLSPLRIAQWGVIVKCNRKLSTAWKKHIFLFVCFRFFFFLSWFIFIGSGRRVVINLLPFKITRCLANLEFKRFCSCLNFLILNVKGKYKECKKEWQIWLDTNLIQPEGTISRSRILSGNNFLFQYINAPPHVLISRKSTVGRGLFLPPELCKKLRVLADIEVMWFGYLASQSLLLRKLRSLRLLPAIWLGPICQGPCTAHSGNMCWGSRAIVVLLHIPIYTQ